ncbi:MAG: hypothetical protein UW18_C0012G0002 [Microgenomates group bacterium GW2011_GWF1_44_10]|nr:MAG: hypothetical protein UW18_C0012G0002 [Microgenomates group bacterium GW2011_GWF1_44_10]
MDKRLIKIVRQGKDETVYYTWDMSLWGSSPTNIAVIIYSFIDRVLTDVSSTCLVGSPSAVGNVISLPGIYNLTSGVQYRVEVQFTTSTLDVLEGHMIINAED